MDRVRLQAELVEDEGRRVHPYKDSRGIWTAGIGHNLEAAKASWSDISVWLKTGVPDQVIVGWYNDDVNKSVACCREIFHWQDEHDVDCGYDSLPDNVQRVLVNMAFVLRFNLLYWHDLKEAIVNKDWRAAAMSIMSSKFAHEAPNRCSRLAARMIQG
jgi:GH24 family phage-related lysozyme (muramidase)